MSGFPSIPLSILAAVVGLWLCWWGSADWRAAWRARRKR